MVYTLCYTVGTVMPPMAWRHTVRSCRFVQVATLTDAGLVLAGLVAYL
jgi:hypothetical protein